MPLLTTASLSGLQNCDVGPGIALKNVVDVSPAGIDKVLQGKTAYGQKLGNMTAAPQVTIEKTTIDITEPIVGLNAALKGARRVTRVDASIQLEIVDMTPDNYKLFNPGQTSANWLSSASSSVVIGTGNAAFEVAARTPGTAGDTITVTTVAGSGTMSPTTAVAAGTAITVTLGTSSGSTINATANDVVSAINASTTASLIAQAGLPTTSNGTGVQTATTSTPLTGGAAGSTIGTVFTDNAVIRLTDYAKNLCFITESPASKVNTVWVFFDCVATENYEASADDDGNVTGISQTFMAHASESSFDPTTGVYLPGYRRYSLNQVLVA